MALTNYDKSSLILPMDGSNGGTTFTDWSPNTKTITVGGNTQTSTTQSKYYGSSGLFDGAGDYLTIANHADFAFGSSDFGIGIWTRPTSLTTDQEIIAHRNTADTANFWLLRINATTGTIRFYCKSSNVTLTDITSIGTVSINVWNYIEVNRITGLAKLYVAGANNDNVTTNSTAAYVTPNYPLYIGVGDNSLSSAFTGNMNDLIITKSTPLHSADFTPPTRLIGEITGNVKDINGANASRIITACPRTNPTRSFSTISDAGTGNYTLRVPATEVSRIALADEVTLYNDIVDRIIPE